MISFDYQAREASGAQVRGTIEATDRRDALKSLAQRGLFPTSLQEGGGDGAGRPAPARAEATRPELRTRVSGAAAFQRIPTAEPRGRVSRREITAFTREMATLLAATIPIPAALQGLGEEEENPALKQVLLDLAAFVRAGNSFSDALSTYPRLFPKLYTSMVRAGEEAGALDKVLADLADLLEHQDEVRAEVVSAVAYPCFVLGLGAVTTFVLLVFVLPQLFTMLQGMAPVLPLPTRALLAASTFFQANWYVVLALFALAFFLVRAYLRSAAGSFVWDSLKLKLPLLGLAFRSAALGRFARTLGTLAGNGVSILPALAISRDTVGNQYFARKIEEVAEETRGGDSLALPLRTLRVFPPTMVQMIGVGEETGRLDAMLMRVAAIQERIAHGRARTLISLLAPALILLVGALVGFIVISLLLPIFQMSQSIR